MINQVDTHNMIQNQQAQDRHAKFQEIAKQQQMAEQVNDDKKSTTNRNGLIATAVTLVSATLLNGS